MIEARKSFYIRHKLKIISTFAAIFCITTLNLCAEEMTTAKARVCRENLVTEVKKYVGCPYVYGSTGPDTFDCSGLIYYSANQANKTQLPRTAKALYGYARIIPDKQKEPGDLVFFKTTSSGNISHVGVYIGNNQFISAVSDGPNTGVILSSLNEAYWKPKYAGVGQIYKSGKINDSDEDFVEEPFTDNDNNKSNKTASANKNNATSKSNGKSTAKTSESKENSGTSNKISKKDKSSKITDNVIFDGSIYMAWSLFKPDSFMINFRGTDIQSSVRYDGFALSPGFGFSLRYNAAVGVFQLPIFFSVTPIDFIKFYAGPIFTFGSPVMKWTQEVINPSIFPGIVGISFSTPSFTKGNIKVQIVQDISYSICNTEDRAALNFVDSITAGLVFFTGIKVTLPLSTFTGN